MILAVDSSALALLVNPAANPPDDPATGKPVEHARERVEYFIASLTASDTMIIPTPVLAEALVRAEDGVPDYWRSSAAWRGSRFVHLESWPPSKQR